MDFTFLLTIALVLSPVFLFAPVRCQVASCNAGGAVLVLSARNASFCEAREQVCQVRLDFERLELPQPQLNANSGLLECVDFLQIQHFRLCGRSSGQHLYLPIGRGQELQLLFRLATPLGRQSSWQVTLTQLECPRDSAASNTRQTEVQTPTVRPLLPFLGNFLPRTIFGGQTGIGSGSGPAAQLIQTLTSPSLADLEMLAPLGCDQYFTTATGGIVSFNFAGGIYMPNMKYSICVKGAADSEISYKIVHFELSKANAEQQGPAYDTDCRSTVLTPLRVSDYLSIPNAYMVGRPELQATYYCGNGLAGQELVARPPFVLRFASDSQSSGSESGFQLTYTVRRSQDTPPPVTAEL